MPKKTEGQWQLEAQCGDCGSGFYIGDPVAKPSAAGRLQAMAASGLLRECESLYMGRPGNRCGWLVTFVWMFVPKGRDHR
jgi:hypothetical protein